MTLFVYHTHLKNKLRSPVDNACKAITIKFSFHFSDRGISHYNL